MPSLTASRRDVLDGRVTVWGYERAYTAAMRLQLHVPYDTLEQVLERGHDVSRAVLETLAIDAYPAGGRQRCQPSRVSERVVAPVPSMRERLGASRLRSLPLAAGAALTRPTLPLIRQFPERYRHKCTLHARTTVGS